MKERILKLLAQGIKASDITGIVGCSASYISQLANDEDFKLQLTAAREEFKAKDNEEEHLDIRYQNLEHKILNNIEHSLAGSELPQLTRALEVVAKRQIERSKVKNPVPNVGNQVNLQIVNVGLPAHIVSVKPNVVVNSQNEIISINGAGLAPLSSDGVKNLFAKLNPNRCEATHTPASVDSSDVEQLHDGYEPSMNDSVMDVQSKMLAF
jgi:hypothetical protein